MFQLITVTLRQVGLFFFLGGWAGQWFWVESLVVDIWKKDDEPYKVQEKKV